MPEPEVPEPEVLEPEVRPDHDRRARIGLDEAILCAHKTPDQLATILDGAGLGGAHKDRARLLLTRLDPGLFGGLSAPHRERIDYDPLSATGFVGPVSAPAGPAAVAVVTAGTSDFGVAREAVRTLAYHGEAAREFHDVGVAGLWRLLEHVEDLSDLAVVIVVAGMDAALPSVVGGLVPGLVIAVPTSTGYGIARGGETALNAALASCAPGVVVTNIDNGYGAACAALRALGAARRAINSP